MFTGNVFNSNLDLAGAIICTAIVCAAFIGMSFSYTFKRAGQSYAENRCPAPSISSFSQISKILFVTSMLLTLVSFWFDSVFFLRLYDNLVLQFTGSFCILIGFISLKLAFAQLGHHYSPSFDAYIPTGLVTTGQYRYIRHPIYLFNLFVSFGLAIASGSILVAVNALIGLCYILKIIAMEEAYLRQSFPEYHIYAKSNWRLLPFCY